MPTLQRTQAQVDRDRRSEASKAGRELIRETATLVHEQTYRYLAAPALTKQLLRQHEPVVDRLVFVSNGTLLTKPRRWVRDLMQTLSAAMLVEIVIQPNHREGPALKVTGRWSDVQLAELVIQRTLVLAEHAATYAYRTSARQAAADRRRRSARGARKRWLLHYVTFLRAALGHVYERLAEEFSVDSLRAVVHNLEAAAQLPEHPATGHRARKRVAAG